MLYGPNGQYFEVRQKMPPASNVHLSDGRILRFKGELPGFDRSAVYQCGDGLRVICSLDETQHGNLMHVSVSRAKENPSWDDLKAVRAAFFDSDIDCMMVMPKKEDYVNIHNFCFHIWQTPTQWGVT